MHMLSGYQMTFPDERPAPTWVVSGAKPIKGLDLLGLRLPVQAIGNNLLDGITTITPSIRYLTFRSWIIYAYIEARRPDEWKTFSRFSSSVEAAIALGNILAEPGNVGVLGSIRAKELVGSARKTLPLEPLVKQIGMNIYAGPSEQLKLSFSSTKRVPGLTKERGVPLAAGLDGVMQQTKLGKMLSAGKAPKVSGRTELEELGRIASVVKIPQSEREQLLNILMPKEPVEDEVNRVSTYAALLALAARTEELPEEIDLYEESMERNRLLSPELNSILNGWLSYGVRDVIAACHECVMRDVVQIYSDRRGTSLSMKEVVGLILDDTSVHEDALKSFGLFRKSDDFRRLKLTSIYDRVVKATSNNLVEMDGFYRWRGKLDEISLFRSSDVVGGVSLSLLPVAWILACRRAHPGIVEGRRDFEILSHRGWSRVGMNEVVRPLLDKFRDESWLYVDVIRELAERTVDQHLRVAWSRMAADPQRDVSVLQSDGEKYRFKGEFESGVTASRLTEAVSWLRQLRLVGEKGITPMGARTLKRALATLRRQM
ncbi:hypothetical protein N9903_01015 [bacterium]|nr:hypothetical protein [bacterium]